MKIFWPLVFLASIVVELWAWVGLAEAGYISFSGPFGLAWMLTACISAVATLLTCMWLDMDVK